MKRNEVNLKIHELSGGKGALEVRVTKVGMVPCDCVHFSINTQPVLTQTSKMEPITNVHDMSHLSGVLCCVYSNPQIGIVI